MDPKEWHRDRVEFERWRDQRDDAEDDLSEAVPAKDAAAGALSAFLLYLADGYDSGCLALRAAVLLRVLRPALVGGAKDGQIASKLGVESAAFALHKEQLFPYVPALGGRTEKETLVSLNQLRTAGRESRRAKLDALTASREARRAKLDALTAWREARRAKLTERAAEARLLISQAAQADSVLAELRAKWSELDTEVSKRCAIPEPTPETEGLDAFERCRRSILAKREGTA